VNWFYFTNPSQEVFLTLARLNVQPAFLELDKRKLASRLAYVVSKQRKATLIKTIEVLDQCFDKRTLNSVKRKSAQNYGRNYKDVMKETRERYLVSSKENIVKEFDSV